ncbi:MAG: hypothetical protein M0R44_02570 [Candidatus Marinimicrobia bacterium]|jgi:hypothetical protein|nr:hypothetical protein [Candidatus Neomarinimicrobiota bacterium]
MMKRIYTVLIFSSLIFVFLTCTDSERQTASTLSLLRTDYGGCNGFMEVPRWNWEIKEDGLSWEISDDTLKIFSGIEYICCAPFVVESQQNGDSLTIMIRDTCYTPYETCYCRCTCYYEFLTLFTGYNGDRYNLAVWLHDPRQVQDSLLWQVEIP